MMIRKNWKSLRESQRQKLNAELVHTEVYACVSGMVYYVLGRDDDDAPFCWDDFDNVLVFNRDELLDTLAKPEHEAEVYRWLGENGVDKASDLVEEKDLRELATAVGLDPDDFVERQEVLEWWICSNWLIQKLKTHKEVVLESEQIWGRTTSGQSINIDNVIYEICEDLWDNGWYFDKDFHKLDESFFQGDA